MGLSGGAASSVVNFLALLNIKLIMRWFYPYEHNQKLFFCIVIPYT